MKRHVIAAAIVLAVLVVAWTAFAQAEERAGQREEVESMRQRFQNMSPEEREKFRAEMRERRDRWENMSEAEREKLREEMRRRFGVSGPRSIGRETQLNAVKAIEAEVAKLKAAVEGTPSGMRERFQGLSEAERTKFREKVGAAFRTRQSSIRAIEEQLTRLKGPASPAPDAATAVRELTAIREMAAKEKATKTAERLETLIARYRTRPPYGPQQSPERRPRPERERRERPATRERNRE